MHDTIRGYLIRSDVNVEVSFPDGLQQSQEMPQIL